jgi:hypothetical protein
MMDSGREEYWMPKKMCFWVMNLNLSGGRGMGTPMCACQWEITGNGWMAND